MYRQRQTTKTFLSANTKQTTGVVAEMNFTDQFTSSSENSSEETNVWNSTESSTSRRSTTAVDWSTYLLVVIEWITFVVGSVGNILVLVVLLWRRSKSQVGTQVFVGSLAVADLGLMFSTVWVDAYHKMKKDWPFGVIPCKLKCMCQFLTLNCSIWTLAALSIDRYLCAWKYS